MYKYFNEKDDPNMIGLHDKLMMMLDNARAFAGIPFIITSGLRTKEKNEKVGGVSNSAHLTGLACDLRCNNSKNRYSIVYALLMAGFKRIEINSAHIHVDIDDTKEQDIIFFK